MSQIGHDPYVGYVGWDDGPRDRPARRPRWPAERGDDPREPDNRDERFDNETGFSRVFGTGFDEPTYEVPWKTSRDAPTSDTGYRPPRRPRSDLPTRDVGVPRPAPYDPPGQAGYTPPGRSNGRAAASRRDTPPPGYEPPDYGRPASGPPDAGQPGYGQPAGFTDLRGRPVRRAVPPQRNGSGRPLPVGFAEPGRPASEPPDIYDVDDEEEPREYGFGGAAVATILWYVLPALGYLGWALLLDAKSRPGCVDGGGAPCLAPRDQALHNLLHDLPRLGVAIAISLLAAVVIRTVTPIWRGISVGFAAAVVGAGLATVLFSVLTGSVGG